MTSERLSRAEFEVWSRAYQAAFGPWTARFVDCFRGADAAEIGKMAADAATVAADAGLESWRRKRKEIA